MIIMAEAARDGRVGGLWCRGCWELSEVKVRNRTKASVVASPGDLELIDDNGGGK